MVPESRDYDLEWTVLELIPSESHLQMLYLGTIVKLERLKMSKKCK